MRRYDTVVVGGGIAGVSIAYELAADQRVVLLDMESQLAFHTTGRSAATFLESYGGRVVRVLTTSSRVFLDDPPEGFDRPLLSPRGGLWLAPPGRAAAVEALEVEVRELAPTCRLLSPDEAVEVCPALREEFVEAALFEPDAMDMDVHAMHQGYVRGFRARGGDVATARRVVALEHAGDRWHVTDSAGETYDTAAVVNAAGAWADELGALAGARPLGLQPMIRSIFMVQPPAALGDISRLPLTADVDMTFYFKPEGPQLLCSPADEVPSDPCDARPVELEIARALDRLDEATTLQARHVTSSWAGLRSFVADRVPVAGYDDKVEGFFWLAGQGGYGIQTAPALARVAAALVQRSDLPADVTAKGLVPGDLHRSRVDRVSSTS